MSSRALGLRKSVWPKRKRNEYVCDGATAPRGGPVDALYLTLIRSSAKSCMLAGIQAWADCEASPWWHQVDRARACCLQD